MKVVKTVSLGVITGLFTVAVLLILLLLNIADFREIIDNGSRALAIIGVITLFAASVQGVVRLNH